MSKSAATKLFVLPKLTGLMIVDPLHRTVRNEMVLDPLHHLVKNEVAFSRPMHELVKNDVVFKKS